MSEQSQGSSNEKQPPAWRGWALFLAALAATFGLGVLGGMLTLLVPMARAQFAQRAARAEPVPALAASLRRVA